MIHRKLARYGILLALSISCSPMLYAELPLITDARVPATPPGATVAAGYLTLTNSADKPLILRGVSSTTVPKVELHRTEVKNDVASMKKQSDLTVPPGETLALDHGGYHLMLMDLEAPLEVGDVIDLTLDTSAGEVDLSMPVVEAGTSDSDSQGHDGGSMQEHSMDDGEMNEESKHSDDMSDKSMNGDHMNDEMDAEGMDHDAVGN